MSLQPAWALQTVYLRLAQVCELIRWLVNQDANAPKLKLAIDQIELAQEIVHQILTEEPLREQ